MAELFITENGVPQTGNITTWIHNDMDKYKKEVEKYQALTDFIQNNSDKIYDVMRKGMSEEEATKEINYLTRILNPRESHPFLCGISAGCKVDINRIIEYFTKSIQNGNFGVFPDSKQENFDWKKTAFAKNCIITLNKMSLVGTLAHIYNTGKSFDDNDFSQAEKAQLLQAMQDKYKTVLPVIEKDYLKADLAEGYGRTLGLIAIGLKDGLSEEIFNRSKDSIKSAFGQTVLKDGKYISTQTAREKVTTLQQLLNNQLKTSYPSIMEQDKSANP